jgi:hypothetical protein
MVLSAGGVVKAIVFSAGEGGRFFDDGIGLE